MLQTALSPHFLHTFDVEYGLWQSVKLGSPVSRRSQEAMNLILLKDGIPAYIGTTSEWSHYVDTFGTETGKGIQRSWISCPGSTVMSKLGLCQNTLMLGKPEMVFYGSPLTLALVYSMAGSGFLAEVRKCACGELPWFTIRQDGLPRELTTCELPLILNTSECQEALTYLND